MSKSGKNGAEARLIPNTSVELESCLLNTKMINDHHGASTILTPNIVARLNAIQPLYRQTRASVFRLKGELYSINRQKDKARNDTAMHTSHFLQVFNMGVARGKYSFADRALFDRPVSSKKLPKLHSDAKITWAAEQVIDGEAKRIADGLPPMANPSGAEVEAQYHLYMQLTGLASIADDVYGDAQKALRGLHKEARAVIKKVWNEVETYYCEGTRERMRKHARDWGVKYARKGGEKILKGTITDAATGLPIGNAKVKFESGKNKTYSGAQGNFTLITNLLHSQTLTAIRSGYSTAEVVIELKEGEENVCVVKMERIAE